MPAKLRSDEIDLFRMVDGDTMLAMLSRDFGSEILPTTSETLLSIVGTLPANFTALSIWNIALSNRIDPRSLLPERGRSMLFGGRRAVERLAPELLIGIDQIGGDVARLLPDLARAVGGSICRGTGVTS